MRHCLIWEKIRTQSTVPTTAIAATKTPLPQQGEIVPLPSNVHSNLLTTIQMHGQGWDEPGLIHTKSMTTWTFLYNPKLNHSTLRIVIPFKCLVHGLHLNTERYCINRPLKYRPIIQLALCQSVRPQLICVYRRLRVLAKDPRSKANHRCDHTLPIPGVLPDLDSSNNHHRDITHKKRDTVLLSNSIDGSGR